MTITDFVKKYKTYAIKDSIKSGVPASITMAQAILESNKGQSRLANEGNNFFGIKCGNDWSGDSMLASDDRPNECFRVYSSPLDSFKDHSQFLKDNPRYKDLFSYASDDYVSWANGLNDDGYATGQGYGDSLISIIEKNGLDKLDGEAVWWKWGIRVAWVLLIAVIVFVSVYFIRKVSRNKKLK